jgi:uncharacterized protein (DUF2236 family)
MDLLREVSGERLVVLGWAPAMLMQFAHPLVAAGVSSHSAFKGRVTEAAARLHNTIGAMLALSFGDPIDREAALSRIRSIHRTVRGTLPGDRGAFPAGTTYSAEDPALLLWVHVTLLDRTADVFQRIVRPLSVCELDAIVDLSAPLLIELGGDAASAPRTWRGLLAQIDDAIRTGTLAVTPTAAELASGVLSPRAAGLPVPLAGLHRLLTIGLLPPFLREAYGFAWDKARETRFARALQLLRAARRVMPDRLARFRQAR